LRTPDGGSATWDDRDRTASSAVYNTPNFLTPLLELPIDRVSATEARQYAAYRQGLRDTLGPYYQPLAVRFSLNQKRVRLDTSLTGLKGSWLFDALRNVAGNGTIVVDSADRSPPVLQLLAHFSPTARKWFTSRDSMGDSWLARLDDGPQYAQLARWYTKCLLEYAEPVPFGVDAVEQLARLPVLAGVRVADRKAFDADYFSVLDFANLVLGPIETRSLGRYKGVAVLRGVADRRSRVAQMLYGNLPVERRFSPAFYQAHVGDTWYVALNEAVLHHVIDRAPASGFRREVKSEGTTTTAAATLQLRRPSRFLQALDSYLEWETHRRALNTAPTWYGLYRGGLLAPEAPSDKANETALHFLGYIPVSPEGVGFAFDAHRDEIVNRRHGSVRRPYLFSATDPVAPLNRLFDLLLAGRLELRLTGDGVVGSVAIDQTALPH
jgi:hypothetical protein